MQREVIPARILRPILLLALLLATAACGTAAATTPTTTPAVSAPVVSVPVAAGGAVEVVVSGTPDEPLPTLTASARQALRQTAEDTPATDGPGGPGSSATVRSADGGTHAVIALTPRRANGAVEHGPRRGVLVDDAVGAVAGAVTTTTAPAGPARLDLLDGLDQATRGGGGGLLVVVSNGLSISAGFDVRSTGWLADPDVLAADLHSRGLLPDLTGWNVLWTGLGAVAGHQTPLPKPIRTHLQAYWAAICRASGAATCVFDDAVTASTPPAATGDWPTVAIPAVESFTGPSGDVTETLPDALLGFQGDSAALTPEAVEIVGARAAAIEAALAARPDATVSVVGRAADPPGSTLEGRRALSFARARAVADALARAGLTHPITVVGEGTPAGSTAMHNGVFGDTAADQLRVCVIRYRTGA